VDAGILEARPVGKVRLLRSSDFEKNWNPKADAHPTAGKRFII